MEKKMMLKNILQLFPSGIVFFNQSEGFFYKNKYWMDLLKKYNQENKFKFWSHRLYQHKLVKRKSPVSEFDDDTFSYDKETQLVLNSLYLKDNSNHSLIDEILKIHSHFYDRNVDLNMINEQRMDHFI
mmetsp:Transcript_1046/g.1016  ORF Transcript_1046/g.1016 Transcript_1046/m.1016 type:complete len:128 (-) Transcript_1046:128-511(-)